MNTIINLAASIAIPTKKAASEFVMQILKEDLNTAELSDHGKALLYNYAGSLKAPKNDIMYKLLGMALFDYRCFIVYDHIMHVTDTGLMLWKETDLEDGYYDILLNRIEPVRKISSDALNRLKTIKNETICEYESTSDEDIIFFNNPPEKDAKKKGIRSKYYKLLGSPNEVIYSDGKFYGEIGNVKYVTSGVHL